MDFKYVVFTVYETFEEYQFFRFYEDAIAYAKSLEWLPVRVEVYVLKEVF